MIGENFWNRTPKNFNGFFLKIFNDLLKIIKIFKKLAGPLGIGKSALLVQAVTYAMCKPWIVIYIPHGKNHLYDFYRMIFSILINSLFDSHSICE